MALAGVTTTVVGCLASVLRTLANTLPITTRLLAPNLLPGVRRSICSSGTPPRPTASRLSARFTAIPAQCVDGAEPQFAILQQTLTSARTANASALNRAQAAIIMLRAHGSVCSPTVKSRSEALNFASRRFTKRRANPALTRPPVYRTGESVASKNSDWYPTPRSTIRESAPTVPSRWSPLSPPLTSISTETSLQRPYDNTGPLKTTATGNWTFCFVRMTVECENARWPTICHGCGESPSHS